MMVAIEGSVIYPVVVVKVNNATCLALLDTIAGLGVPMHPQQFWKN